MNTFQERLVASLIDLRGSVVYLKPEWFDEEEHEAEFDAMVAAADALIAEASEAMP